MQAGQELLGGCGLTPDEPIRIDSPVEVAPVPQQWTQPAVDPTEQPVIETEPDPLDLDDNTVTEPMEI